MLSCCGGINIFMLKIAIVHDWLINLVGSEKVLEAVYQLYPDTDIYMLVKGEES